MARLRLVVLGFGLLVSLRSMGSPGLPESEATLIDLLQKPILTEDDRNELFFRGEDDPKTLIRDLVSIWKKSEGSPNKLLKARTGWMFGMFGSDDNMDSLNGHQSRILIESMALIEAEKLPVSVHEIRFNKLLFDVQSGGELAEFKNQLILQAEKIEDQKMRANSLSRLAFYFLDRGVDSSEIPHLLSKVRQLISTETSDLAPIEVDTLNTLSITLAKLGQFSEAKEIGGKLNEICELKKMRYFCSVQAYATGYGLIKENLPDGGVQSIPYFLKALELAKDIQDQDNIASSYFGLNLAYNNTKDFPAAIPYGIMSADIYEKLGAKVEQAIALNNLSASYVGSHNFDLALKTVQKAQKICPPEYKIHRLKIFKQLSLVYEALGQYQEAFRYLGLFVEQEKATSSEDANKKYMQLRNQSLSKQNELQAEQIQLLKKFRVVSLLAVSLSLIICFALLKVWRQASVIRRSRQKMKQVLDHIDEGIAILDRNLCIASEYSPYLDKIFGRETQSLQNTPLLDLLFPKNAENAHQGAIARETLIACIGEQDLSWELNHSHLPNEIQFQEIILALHWQALYNSQKSISSFLVSIRDITELRNIEKKMALESQRVQKLQKKLEEVLQGKIALIRNLFKEITDTWPQLQQQIHQQDTRPMVLRRLHSWKGAARTLGLKLLAGSIHEMESALLSVASEHPNPIETKWLELSLSIQDYEHLLNTLLVSQHTEESVASDLYAFASLYSKEMKERLNQVGCPQKGVTVLDHVHTWKPNILPRIHEILLHAVANAVDHGFLRPLQDHKILAPAFIQILALPIHQQIELQVLDNGAGIQWSRLRKKAEDIGFTPKPGQSLTDLLFRDGVSTAETTTETSGRGVGLSAIRSLCLEMGGTLSLEDAEGGGTALKMVFPMASLTK